MSKSLWSCLSLCLALSSFGDATFFKRFEDNEDGSKTVYLYRNAADLSRKGGSVACAATYLNMFGETGWDVLQVQTNPGITDLEQAECAGEAEGAVTVEAIYNYYYNNVKFQCQGRRPSCRRVAVFLKKHLDWVEQSVKTNASSDPIWHHVSLFYSQVKGLHTGYMESVEKKTMHLTLHDFILMNLQNDLDDVADALEGDVSAKVKGETRCSSLVKLLPHNKDLLVAHNTWTSFVQMNRILKRYDMALHTTDSSSTVVSGRNISFSGYPGVITSGDDFYVTSAGLIALETTIGNSNASLWSYVQPTGQIFETVRSMVALRLADNGKSWSEIFSQYNSGTYNNQWMIVDYNKFTKGKSLKPGTLYILEQIPGYIRYADQTKVLKRQLYWPSYNEAFYKDIFNLSGNQELVDEYGDWFTYDLTARALIFKRDQSSVVDVDSMMTLMRSNNYTHDEYARCNCTPPYSAENAIAARSDLNPKNGTYPFDALGNRLHGAIDAKVVSPLYAQNMTFIAVSGPTKGANLPEFSWKKSAYKKKPHRGQPDSFNFSPIVTPWPNPVF